MQSPFVSRAEAKEMGFTHEGSIYGFPVWVIELDPGVYRYLTKMYALVPVVEFVDDLFTSICQLFWMMNDDLVFRAPFTLKGPI